MTVQLHELNEDQTVSLHHAYQMALRTLASGHITTPSIERKLADAVVRVFIVESVGSSPAPGGSRGLAQRGLDRFMRLYGSETRGSRVDS